MIFFKGLFAFYRTFGAGKPTVLSNRAGIPLPLAEHPVSPVFYDLYCFLEYLASHVPEVTVIITYVEGICKSYIGVLSAF